MVTRKPQRVNEAPTSVQRPPHRPAPRTEPEAPAGNEAAGGPAGGTGGMGGIRLTGRGGILLISAVSLVAALIGHVVGSPPVSGVAFTAACVTAALLVRPGDLLSLAVSPPLAYFLAALGAEMCLAAGEADYARAVAVGMATRLADVAPSLFLGTALVLVIAVFRGLPADIRAFSDELNGRSPRNPPQDKTRRTG
ncbi:DUF6542 domain-containing protein [Streptomonospora wellingtoniae]|uniref:DUF6542 domain-containing protein n=1 Tax=Streptomonospora wellingtoniae TaxID=3075544 RepID=A0ABU2KZX7_9ACTN|nr:DUF6542 domain-containing protein [Streptomonospora sp. DSM 45055]MDT0304830.1 hypothetical protein [Streptomonospora sp. DSM 45055]